MNKTLAALLCSCLLAHAHNPVCLKVAHQRTPLGVDDTNPRLSWQIDEMPKEKSQSAFQILATTSPGLQEPGKADLWDSGKFTSSTTHTPYAGKPLPSSSWVHWTVRIWSGDTASEWSRPEQFLTALIGTDTTWKTFTSLVMHSDTPFLPNTTAELTLPKQSPWRSEAVGSETRTLPPGTHKFVTS